MIFVTKFKKMLEDWLCRDVRASDTSLCYFERIRHELKSCDVLLIEGRSRVSQVIRFLTHSNWTHAALYIGRIYDVEDPHMREIIRSHFNGSEEEQLIMESELGLGTVIRPLNSYESDHIRICRPKNLSHKDGQQVISYVISQLGKEYHTRQIFDLMRFLLPYRILPRRLGSSLFNRKPGSATKTVCSSMIAEAFCFIQFPILPLVKITDKNDEVKLFHRNPKLCTPKDFDYSPYFQIIKYPFFDCTYHEGYRLLPWGKGSEALGQYESAFYMTQDQLNALRNITAKSYNQGDMDKGNEGMRAS